MHCSFSLNAFQRGISLHGMQGVRSSSLLGSILQKKSAQYWHLSGLLGPLFSSKTAEHHLLCAKVCITHAIKGLPWRTIEVTSFVAASTTM